MTISTREIRLSRGPVKILQFDNLDEYNAICTVDKTRDTLDLMGGYTFAVQNLSFHYQIYLQGAYSPKGWRPAFNGTTNMQAPDLTAEEFLNTATFLTPKAENKSEADVYGDIWRKKFANVSLADGFYVANRQFNFENPTAPFSKDPQHLALFTVRVVRLEYPDGSYKYNTGSYFGDYGYYGGSSPMTKSFITYFRPEENDTADATLAFGVYFPPVDKGTYTEQDELMLASCWVEHRPGLGEFTPESPIFHKNPYNDYSINGEFTSPLNMSDYDLDGNQDMMQPRIATKGVSIYKMTKSDVQGVLKDLWEVTFGEKIASFFGQTKDGILSLRWYYGLQDKVDAYPQKIMPRIGNTTLNTEAEVCNKEFITYTLDTLPVPESHNNYLDFAPYTQVSVYVPFYGYFNVDPAYCMGGKIKIEYSISLFTGTSAVKIYTQQKGTSQFILYDHLTVNLSVDIPIDAKGVETLESKIATGILKGSAYVAGGVIGGGIGAVAMGGAATVAGEATEAATMAARSSAIGNFASGVQSGLSGGLAQHPTRAGGFSSEIGVLCSPMCELLITSPEVANPDISEIMGSPSYQIKNMSEFKNGFVKIAAIHPSSQAGTKYAYQVNRLLTEGVYR